MAIILLVMQRKAIVQGLINRLRNYPDILLIYEPDYPNAEASTRRYDAKVALIEAAESGPYDTAYCLTLCERLRQQTPGCALLLMCPEQDQQSVKLVVSAKGEKQIDDFVFYDVTIDYLVSKLITI
jgi:hypothetical protein